MRRTLHSAMLALLALLVLAGCASPETRIKDQPDVFASATPEQQALIRKGQVGIGFKPEFVKLALGEPDRITERTDSSGAEQTWHYTDSSPAYVPAVGYYDPYGPFYPGPYFGLPPWYTPVIPAAPAVETDLLRVTFRNGVVSAIERVVK